MVPILEELPWKAFGRVIEWHDGEERARAVDGTDVVRATDNSLRHRALKGVTARSTWVNVLTHWS